VTDVTLNTNRVIASAGATSLADTSASFFVNVVGIASHRRLLVSRPASKKFQEVQLVSLSLLYYNIRIKFLAH
jgi:hypothetical protein